MSDAGVPNESFLGRLFERPDPTLLSPAARIVAYFLLILWALVCLLPLYWVLITSFKLPIQVDDGPYYIPFVDFVPSLDAWRYLFVEVGNDTIRPYVNSVIVAFSATIIAVLIGSLAAYALVRTTFQVRIAAILTFLALLILTVVAVAALKVPWQLAVPTAIAIFILFLMTAAKRYHKALGNSDIEFWIISNRILPPIVVVVPIYLMFQQFHLLDTHVALISAYTAVNLPIVVWLMRDFFAAIPYEIEESAAIDGCGRFRTFFTIVLPLARSGLAATFMLVLILCWNEYLLALFLSNANSQTMPILVSAQNGTRGPQWWYMSALIVVMVAPVVAISVALQKHIARGILVGGVKG